MRLIAAAVFFGMLMFTTACSQSETVADSHELDMDKVEETTPALSETPVAAESLDADSLAAADKPAPRVHRHVKKSHKKKQKHARNAGKKHKKKKHAEELSLQPE